MVTESPLREVESRGVMKWHSFKDVATFGSPLEHTAIEEPGIIENENGEDLVPSRSGSAPPSMGGSFAPVTNHLTDQKLSANSSLADFKNTLENVESEEEQPSDPANLSCHFAEMDKNHHAVECISSFRDDMVLTSTDDSGNGPVDLSQGSASSQKKETEEDSPPLRASQDVAESSVAAAGENNTISSASRHKSLVDLIQEDFPRTPSPVYNQSRSSSNTKTDELADYDANAIPIKRSCVDKSPETSSHSSGTIQSGVPFSTSFPSSIHLDDETGKPPRDESRDKYVNLGYSSTLDTPRIDSRTNLQIKMSQEKQQSYRKNVPKSTQEHFPYKVHRVRGQTTSQGMHQLPGFTPPYAEASAFMASGNQLFPNLQPSGFYAPQYNLPGYTSSSTLFAPFMAGYSPHSLQPFPSSLSYNAVTTGDSAPDGIPHVGDVRQQSKFYGQHVSMPQHSLGDYLHVQFCPQPSQEVYGSSVQHGQSASAGVFGNHFAQPEPTFSAYMGDQRLHLLTNGNLNVSMPIKMEISGYGNSPFVNVISQLPSSAVASPVMSTSSIAGGNYTGHRAEMRYSQGSIRNPGTCSEWQGKRGSNDSDVSKKISFLEELKSSDAQKIELSNIEGCIVDFSIDQHGSRFIQQKLEHCSAEEKMSVFKEVFPHASRLMVDVFGNYVIQKFLEYGSDEQRKELADALSGQMLSLSLQMYGCRVIQKALEVIELDRTSLLVKELDGHVMKCVHDQNGNHVIQKCIECLPTEEIGFIISSFQGHVPKLATHSYGCRVMQRVLEHCLDDIQCQCIIDEILESACVLAQDQYGNYVIQHILKRGKPHERSQIINKLIGRVVQLSQHKFASNVVEKCLVYGNTTEQELLIEEILDHSDENDNLLAMMKDQYANYVVQKIFETGNERQREILLDRTRVHLHALRKYTYGKHIAARFEQLSGEESGVA